MSALFERDDATAYLCKYKVDNFILMLDDQKVELDASNIMSIEYLCDYEYNLRAILKVSLRIDVRRKMWILKNKRDIVAKLELSRIGMDHDQEEQLLDEETVWNLEFGLYFNDDEENTDTTNIEDRLEINDNTSQSIDDLEDENYFESQNTIDLYLFNQDLLNASTKIYNGVMTSDTQQEYVGRILTETGHKNVLISKFENSTVYTELLIPALPTYKALEYLDLYYGFYKRGGLIFYDVDCLYILNTDGKCSAKREDEWPETMVLVNELNSATPGDGMLQLEEEKVFYVSVSEMNINIEKQSIGNNAIYGSNATVVVVDSTEIETTEADQSYISQRNQAIVYRYDDDNKYSSSILKARMEENECLLYITCSNVDIRAFTPNKQFQITFDNTSKQEQYGSYRYRLAYASHVIKAESESWMSCSSQILLKRCAEEV